MSAPWKKKAPAETGPKTKLTPASIEWARARAKAAGRRYPNLVDNMAATRRQVEQEMQAKGPGFLRNL
ncbi:MAG TPA: hypothetical protein PLF88_10335 [Opitutaceae bacterium]|nr:hypothetical protein [Opitutaceae bacterium]HRJ46428.1 hypothetical protein [Opitutaceae bacterium]